MSEALSRINGDMVPAPLDYCTAHLGTDLYSTDGMCVLVPLYRKAEQQ